MKTTSFIFNYFKEFAEFCLNTSFEKICASYYNNIKSLDLPLLSVFRDVHEKELMNFFRERLHVFLNDALADRVMEEILTLTDQWRHGALPYEVNKYSIQPSDLLVGFGIRKDVLLQYLPEFTNNVSKALLIVQELNQYHLLIEDLIFKLCAEIQQDIIRKKNDELQISNELLLREIKEKEKTLKALSREKAFKETLINNVNFGVLAFDRNLRITAWNRILEENNNLKKDDVIGRHLFDIFPDYKISGEEIFFRNVLEGATINLEEFNRNGKKGFFDAVLIPLKPLEKKISGGICIVNDTTARKVLEDKLKISQAELKEIQEIAHLGIWEWNIKSQKLKCSEEILRLFHMENHEGEITSAHFSELIEPEDNKRLEDLIERAIALKQPFSAEFKLQGSSRYLYIRGKVVSIHNKPYKLKGIIFDISERKRIEEEVRAKNQALIEKNEELGKAEGALILINNELEERVEERTFQLSVLNEELQKEVLEREKAEGALKQRNEELLRINDDLDNFVYSASHDLKAPISNIEGLIIMLEAELKAGNSDSKMIMDLIHRSIGNFKDTLQGLTDIAKISDISADEESIIEIDNIVEEIKLNIKGMISSCNAEVITDFSGCPSIRFSRTNLKSILYNLMSNAIKYRSPFRTPNIVIRTGCENDYVYFEVKDNGIGFDPSLKNNIFSMFKRLHFHVDGSGIGLYLVKRIVDKNGGRIEVDSAPDKGTTFKVYLKAA